MSESAFVRNVPLFGERAMAALKRAHVLVVGLGGVGSHAALALARSGIGRFTLVDFDTVDTSNINRQAIAFHSTIGKAKSALVKAQIIDINPDAHVRTFTEYYKADRRDTIFDTPYDYIFDCVDNVPAKLDLIVTAIHRAVPILTSAGLGNRMDPSKVQTGNLFDLEGDPLARKLKKALRKEGVHAVDAVYSTEAPFKRAGVARPASCAFVPPIGGIHGAAHIVQELIKKTE